MIISYYESDYIIIIIIIAELSRAIVAKSSLVRRRRVCNKRRCLLYTASRMASCPDDRVIFSTQMYFVQRYCYRAVHIATVVVRVQSSRVRSAVRFLLNK